MNTSVRVFLALALVASAAGFAADAEPKPSPQVLVLENERIVVGWVEPDGDRYRVRRDTGETWVPASQVLRLCRDLEEAYGCVRARANLRDPDERVRLARWCQLYGLRQRAIDEAKAAARLERSPGAGERLLQALERSAGSTSPPGPVAGNHSPRAPESPPELSAELRGQFITRVQPVLMNTCAPCHLSDRGGSFKLSRTTSGANVDQRATRENLTAVLAQVRREQWDASPLLTRAVNVHGPATQPPVKNVQAPAFRLLEGWVRAVAGSIPASTSPVKSVAGTERNSSADFAAARAESPAAQSVAPDNAPVGVESRSIPEPTRPAGPADPFDPAVFNKKKPHHGPH
jgi:hypothetical protein